MRRSLSLLFSTFLLAACSAQSGNGGQDDTGTDTTDIETSEDTDSGTDTTDTGEDPGDDCVDPDNDGYGPGCSAGDDCNQGSAAVNPGATETCGDLIDNNCDGNTDEGCGCVDGATITCYEGPDGSAGVGICREGVSSCIDGEWGPCEGDVTPRDEFCDLLDNNCDGEVDEGVTNACGECGEVQEEVCDDGLDNDCNGTIDDIAAGCACGGRLDQACYGGPPSTLGVGVCTGGTMDCVEGAWGACEGQTLPSAELCDGLDNDCDGDIDEGLRNSCGECGAEDPIELCDGIDNDCDGEVDEGVRAACGLCPDEIGEEICGDGQDNDCDGGVDEECACVGDTACYPGPAGLEGTGICAAGTRACDSSGEFWEECEGYVLPGPDICDGLDNDCDGLVDIAPSGCSSCGTEIEECDGIDNDCDGIIDEGLRNSCGECLADVVPEETLGPEFCDGLDNDCDGLIDEGLLNDCGTCGECSDCEFFTPGWSAAERCGDGQDNDNDGQADEDCPCEFGSTQACFLGPPNSRRIGQCLDGVQSCVDRDNPHWGDCEGGLLPSEEICDEKDNDCNGCVDEVDCTIELFCPVEDTVKPLRDYQLLGSEIFPEGADAYHWEVIPPENSATTGPEDPNAADTSFYVDVSGDYEITLTITVDGEEIECTYILHARGSGLRVELVWNTFGSVDMDLHLHRPASTANWCDLDDTCYYRNCDGGSSPDWYATSGAEDCPDGIAGCHNPRLDIDNIRGYDPENINVDNPSDGDTFRIMVHGYSGSEETHPVISIYCGGLLSSRLGEEPTVVPITEFGSSCGGHTWRVADVTMHIDPESGAHSCDVTPLTGAHFGWDVRLNNQSY